MSDSPFVVETTQKIWHRDGFQYEVTTDSELMSVLVRYIEQDEGKEPHRQVEISIAPEIAQHIGQMVIQRALELLANEGKMPAGGPKDQHHVDALRWRLAALVLGIPHDQDPDAKALESLEPRSSASRRIVEAARAFARIERVYAKDLDGRLITRRQGALQELHDAVDSEEHDEPA